MRFEKLKQTDNSSKVLEAEILGTTKNGFLNYTMHDFNLFK